MEIKRVAIAIAIDNDKHECQWRVKYDYGNGFVNVTKTGVELKAVLNNVMENMVESTTREI